MTINLLKLDKKIILLLKKVVSVLTLKSPTKWNWDWYRKFITISQEVLTPTSRLLLANVAKSIPNINFLFPCTISFPATLTKENFNCFPIFTTWLQFSTFLNGIFIGGLFAIFQLTIPGDTLSRVSKSTHLQSAANFNSKRIYYSNYI